MSSFSDILKSSAHQGAVVCFFHEQETVAAKSYSIKPDRGSNKEKDKKSWDATWLSRQENGQQAAYPGEETAKVRSRIGSSGSITISGRSLTAISSKILMIICILNFKQVRFTVSKKYMAC